MRIPNPVYRVIAALNRDRYRLYHPRNYKVYLNVSESQMMLARALGNYEPRLFDTIGAFLKPGMTFIDVGGNKGDFSLFASQIVGPDGRVVVIEPAPENCAWIRRSIEANRVANVELLEMALAEQNGHAELHLGAKSGFHSLMTDGANAIQVRTAALDALAAERKWRVDAIKIDVEGAELRALAGMMHILRTDRPRLWIEFHPQYGVDVNAGHKLLKDLDYVLTSWGGECEAVPREAQLRSTARRNS